MTKRFTKRTLVPGMAWGTPGVIEGVAALMHAVENLSCQGGHVSWYGGVPVIYPPKGGAGGVIPVQLVVTDLTSELTGDFETQCEFLYDVYAINADTETDDALLEDVDPTLLGHHHIRPTVGAMIAATFGYAHREDGDLKLGFINEKQNPLGIPVPAEEGNFVLTSIDGVISWAETEAFSCPV